MNLRNKATRIQLTDLRSLPMRTFHMTWLSFFLCFFGWFGIAPLMAVVRQEFSLTKEQIGNTIIASVAITIVSRLLIGWICDRTGPRKAYTWLLLVGSIPVMGIGFSSSYETFLIFRLAIGAIGASFVITQFHTSVMFAPNVVGTANATTAGWGNLGGGVTQMVMPLIFSAFLSLGAGAYWGWRLSMILPGIALFLAGLGYYFFTKDTPDGDYQELRQRGEMPPAAQASGAFLEACRDARVWALFLIYGACFGIELTINNIAALYFTDYFGLGLKTAGLVASLFGLMNIFARTLGGVFGDRAGMRWGLCGRVWFLGAVILAEGLALMAFSQMRSLAVAIGALVIFSLFVQMSEGATYSVVPFINKRALGAVAGLVGAGGNAGAVAAGFLFKIESLAWPQALLILGCLVSVSSLAVLVVRFSKSDERAARQELEARLKGEFVPALATAGD
jgi:NNP family nitrate/nitrite transporter-like MFS transporter